MSASWRSFLAGGMAMAGTIVYSITTKEQSASFSQTIADQPLPGRVLGKTGGKYV